MPVDRDGEPMMDDEFVTITFCPSVWGWEERRDDGGVDRLTIVLNRDMAEFVYDVLSDALAPQPPTVAEGVSDSKRHVG